MPNTLTKDHHLLLRNLKLNDNYISNDGGDEGIRITDAGLVGIGVTDPASPLEIFSTSSQLKISYDASNYTDITVADDGHLSIENFGTDADMTLIAKDDIFLEAHGGDIFFQDAGLPTFLFDVAGDPAMKIRTDTNINDWFQIKVEDEGATTLSTIDQGAAVAHLTLDIDGDVILGCVPGGSITLQENDASTYTPSAASDATTKAYVDANAYHFIRVGFFNSGTTKMYMPMPGSEDMREITSPIGAAERISFICPFDGSLETVWARSEGTPGSTAIGFHKSTGAGAEVPSATATQEVTVAMDVDDTSYEFDFAGAVSPVNTFSQGDIIVFSVTPSAAMNDVHFMIVLKFDVST